MSRGGPTGGNLPPKRPTLPFTLLVLVGLMAAEALTLRGAIPRVVPWPGGAVVLAGMVATVLGVRAGGPVARLACVVGMGVLCGMVAGSVALWGLERFQAAMGAGSVSAWTLEVTTDPSLGDYGYRCRAHATKEGCPSGSVWLTCADEPELGAMLSCVGRFSPNQDDEWGLSNRAQGVAGTVKVVRVSRSVPARGMRGAVLRLRSRAIGLFEPSSSGSGALLAASVCGYRAGMDERGLGDLFSACGVSHLVAVSGGHIAVVSGILSTLLEGLGLGPLVRSVLLLWLSGTFVVFCGAPVSAVRSWLMVVVAFGAQLAGRRGHALSAVCLVAIVMALIDPFSSGQLGFVLSVVSVAALCVFSPYASYALAVVLRLPWLHGRLARFNRVGSKVVRSLRDTLAATLVAQAATLPITIPTFGELSLVAPLANLALGPPFSLVIGGGMVAATLGCVPVVGGAMAGVPMLAAQAAADVALATLVPLSRLPLASVPTSGWVVPTVCVVLLVAIYAVWPCVRRKAVCCGACIVASAFALVFIRWRYLAPTRIVVLDVGQGDAILVQDRGAALLVDTGPDASVTQALAREHVLHLDAIVLTHLHDDHVGGVDDLVGTMACDQVYVGDGASGGLAGELGSAVGELTGHAAGELSYGDELEVGGFVLRVVSPMGAAAGTENEDSIELAVSYQRGGRRLAALLTGDAESDRTGELLARGDVGDVDLLKVGHHGSAVSITSEEALALAPEVAVASAGEGNRYGHPRRECVEVLEDVGALFLCTKDVGDVEVCPGREGPVVRYDGWRSNKG